MAADPKPAARVRDPELLRRLHYTWGECALCHKSGRLSLHHISKHPRDDVQANLVMLCGDGVSGCHGKITAEDPASKFRLGAYLTTRPDTMAYLAEKLGGPVAATEWMHQRGLLH